MHSTYKSLRRFEKALKQKTDCNETRAPQDLSLSPAKVLTAFMNLQFALRFPSSFLAEYRKGENHYIATFLPT